MFPTHFFARFFVAGAFLCTPGVVLAQSKSVPAAAAKSDTTSVTKVPTPPSSDKAPGTVLYVPGGYQDWKPASAPQIAAVAGSTTRFEGYVSFTGTGEQPFKFTNAPDWTHTNYGDGGNGVLSTDGLAGGLKVPAGGYYELSVDLDKLVWKATKVEWSVIGNATPGGWEKDTPMNFDAAKQTWSVTLPMKAAGSFKFRANNEWKIDFGLDGDGKLQYVDNPFFNYNPKIKDLTVPDDGTYTLTLDLHVPGSYKYTIAAAK